MQNAPAHWSLDDRVARLKKFKRVLREMESQIFQVAQADLGKSEMETYFELGPLLSEIDHTLKHLKKWMAPQKRSTSLVLFPGKTWVEYRPQGRALILGAWNYPFLLTFAPLINALAAGNRAVCKPSELSPRSAELISRILQASFAHEDVRCELGGKETVDRLFQENWDHIFYTGGERVGKIVAERAVKDLTRFTLELGGKSPFVVDRDVAGPVTARKLVFGKFSNCGQTCVAPDYALVPRDLKDSFLKHLRMELQKQYGSAPLRLPDYGRMVNSHHFQRLQKLLSDIPESQFIVPPEFSESTLQISPTIIDADGLPNSHELRASEIFGPILPVWSYGSERECADLLHQISPTPLCSYFFTERREFFEHLSHAISPGAVVVNDVLAQLANPDFPFGGVRSSGMGRYRGFAGFKNFSNPVSIYQGSLTFDLPLRYRPTTPSKLDWLKRVFQPF
jgi:aldehyde dehydrogenase (NAD+)